MHLIAELCAQEDGANDESKDNARRTMLEGLD